MQFKQQFLSIFLVLCSTISLSQTTIEPLTVKQRLEDFNYLYQELELSYPYFEVNKRVHHIDWLKNKEEYQNEIRNSTSDIEFLKKINDILNDLNNGHTDTYPTKIYSYFYEAYKHAVEEYPHLEHYVKELEKTSFEQCNYWNTLSEKELKNTANVPSEIQGIEQKASESNIKIQFSEDYTVAMISIASFSYDLINEDAEILKNFFNKAMSYKSLIIDIQGNQGGDDTYWMEHIIPHLIDEDKEYPIVTAFKNSERIKKMKPSYKTNIHRDSIALKNLPKELKTDEFKFMQTINTIKSNSTGQKFKDPIYLLVDEKVYSSAESLAYFCKVTKFATVVGKQTQGDGIGSDPLLLTLPNSGIVIRFTGEMALNEDGSSNEEMKTIPDVQINNLKREKNINTVYEMIMISKKNKN